MINITIENMFKFGVHYGHSKKNWNPKMKYFIFDTYNNIHIINLDKTKIFLKKALKKLKIINNNNGKILFVGTKSILQNQIKNTAKNCNQFFVNNRWLGGTLTNWKTVKKSIKKYKILYNEYKNSILDKLTKKESTVYLRKLNKLEKNLSGIQYMNRLPDALFVIDVNHEKVAVKESNKLGIPVFGIVDTNSNPDGIDFIIPGNDDSIKSIEFYLSCVENTLNN